MQTSLVDRLFIVGSIAAKDIGDALQNKLILSQILLLGIILLMPKLMSLILVSPQPAIVIYDPGRSSLVAEMEASQQFRVFRANSLSELEKIIGRTGLGSSSELGLVVPADLDPAQYSEGTIELKGYVAWANRGKADQIGSEMETEIAELLGRPVQIHSENHIVTPSPESTPVSGIMAISGVTIILMVGITLVPGLLFDEKESKTLEALLVSPATIWEVVIGKALTGLFYSLVAAGMVFGFYASGVVHWELAILFTLGSGLFAVAVGLVLGCFFERAQEVTGWASGLLLLFAASMLVKLLALELPTWISAIVDWVPAVTLGQVLLYGFSGELPAGELWPKLGSVLILSALLYAVVAFKLSRSDR